MNTTTQMEILESMEKEVSRVMRTLEILKTRVGRDDLTGLLRRADFFGRLDKLVQNGEVTILMIDIDNFKQINDTEGHQAGDLAIKGVAQIIQRCSKAGATTGRYGGEEFIIAHCAGVESAQALGEALRRQIQKELCLTVSIGVASLKMANQDTSKAIAQADAALYQAKRTGKNKVCLADAA